MTIPALRKNSALALIALVWYPAHAVVIPVFPVTLSTNDRAALVRTACVHPHAVDAEILDAYRYTERTGDTIHADVVCRPYETISNEPLRVRAMCTNSTGRWTCDTAAYLEVRVGKSAASIPVDTSIAGVENADIVRYLLGVRNYDGRDLSQFINGQTCGISKDRTGAWLVGCGSLQISVARDCDHGVCKYRAFGPVGISIP